MTLKETSRVIAYIQTAFPSAWKDVDQDNVMRVWADMFADDDMHSVMMAVKAFVASDSTGFPPAIGQIKSRMARQRMLGEPTEQDAWNHIRKAISNSGYHAAEEFDIRTCHSR